MKCRRVLGESHRYWNIKGWGHFAVRFCANCIGAWALQRAGSTALWHHFGTTSERLIFHGQDRDFAQFSVSFCRIAGEGS